ncbi:MAG TPA: GntR family transcriptional regulator [Ancylobacter sp.]
MERIAASKPGATQTRARKTASPAVAALKPTFIHVKRISRPKTTLSRRIPFSRQVADTLRDMIISGDIPAGSRVLERALCERLKVSRTPLREALKLLEAEGLVEISQNKGARIMLFTPTEAMNLFEVLAGLESLAAEIAATRISEPDLAHIEDMHERMCGYYRSGEKGPYFELNTAIHEAIVRCSGNPVLAATYAGLMLRARRGNYMAILDPTRWEEAVSEHTAIVEALRARNAERARVVWRRHLDRTGSTVSGVLEGVVRDAATAAALLSEPQPARL